MMQKDVFYSLFETYISGGLDDIFILIKYLILFDWYILIHDWTARFKLSVLDGNIL